MKKLNLIFALAALLLPAFTSHATIITLQDNDIRYSGIYEESNFTITAPINLVNGGNLSSRNHLIEAGFSGDYMETWNTEAVFNLAETSGNTFDLIGLDVGSYFSTNAGLAAWTFLGFNQNTLVYSLVNSQFLGRLELNWQELTRFSITSSRSNAASSFDNIEVIASAPTLESMSVSAPGSVSLLPILLLLALRRKRQHLDTSRYYFGSSCNNVSTKTLI